MPNEETMPQQDKVDERIVVLLHQELMQGLANGVHTLNEHIKRVEERDPAAPVLPVLKRELDARLQVFDRLEELMYALAEDKVRIVEEGQLVHAIAKRLTLAWNTSKNDDGGPTEWERYVRPSQDFLAQMRKDKVIV